MQGQSGSDFADDFIGDSALNLATLSSSFAKYFLKTGVPFGVIMGLFFSVPALSQGAGFLLFSIPLGVLSGVVFGLTMAAFMLYQTRKFRRRDPTLNGESLVRHGVANHFKNGEGRGGYLYLTDRRIVFEPHRFNIQRGRVQIPLESIVGIEKFRVLKIIQNGLEIKTEAGTERFAVEDRRGWVAALTSECGERV